MSWTVNCRNRDDDDDHIHDDNDGHDDHNHDGQDDHIDDGHDDGPPQPIPDIGRCPHLPLPGPSLPTSSEPR